MRYSQYITVPLSLWNNRDLSWTEKCVLIEIDSLSGDGGCRMPVGKIANSIGMPRQYVKDTIASLVGKGALSIGMTEKGDEVYVAHMDRKRYVTISESQTEEVAVEQKNEPIDYDMILAEWRRINPNLRQPRIFTPKLQKQLRSLMKNNSCSIEDVIKSFKAISVSDFLNGKNNRGWKARLDWLVSDSNGCWQKLISGAYHQSDRERAELDAIFACEDNRTTDTYYR